MVLLDRSEVRTIPLEVYFNLKFILNSISFLNGVRLGAL
jgi:hypothetical protein